MAEEVQQFTDLLQQTDKNVANIETLFTKKEKLVQQKTDTSKIIQQIQEQNKTYEQNVIQLQQFLDNFNEDSEQYGLKQQEIQKKQQSLNILKKRYGAIIQKLKEKREVSRVREGGSSQNVKGDLEKGSQNQYGAMVKEFQRDDEDFGKLNNILEEELQLEKNYEREIDRQMEVIEETEQHMDKANVNMLETNKKLKSLISMVKKSNELYLILFVIIEVAVITFLGLKLDQIS